VSPAASLTILAMMAHREGTVVCDKQGDLTPILLLGADRIPDIALHPDLAAASDYPLLSDLGYEPNWTEESFFTRCMTRILEFGRSRRTYRTAHKRGEEDPILQSAQRNRHIPRVGGLQMNKGSLEELKEAVERQHGGTARLAQSVAVKETFADSTLWEGVVHVFDLENNIRASRAYAWSSPAEGGAKRRHFAVLHMGAITSPVEAVRAAKVAER